MADSVCAKAAELGSPGTQRKRPMLMEGGGLKTLEGQPAVTREEAREGPGLRPATCAFVLPPNYLLRLKSILNFLRSVIWVRPGPAPGTERALSKRCG